MFQPLYGVLRAGKTTDAACDGMRAIIYDNNRANSLNVSEEAI